MSVLKGTLMQRMGFFQGECNTKCRIALSIFFLCWFIPNAISALTPNRYIYLSSLMLNNLGRVSYVASFTCVCIIFLALVLSASNRRLFAFVTEIIIIESLYIMVFTASMFKNDVLFWYEPFKFRYMCEFYDSIFFNVFSTANFSPQFENNIGICLLLVPIFMVVAGWWTALSSLSMKRILEIHNWEFIFDCKNSMVTVLSFVHVPAIFIMTLIFLP